MLNKKIKVFILIVLMFNSLICSFIVGYTQAEYKYKTRINGLHKQLTRTQYQLKRAREQNMEQTQKISNLTGNGG